MNLCISKSQNENSGIILSEGFTPLIGISKSISGSIINLDTRSHVSNNNPEVNFNFLRENHEGFEGLHI